MKMMVVCFVNSAARFHQYRSGTSSCWAEFRFLYKHNSEMLYVVGLGLGDAKDITVKGLEVVKRAKRVYLEGYTSILTVGKDALVSVSE